MSREEYEYKSKLDLRDLNPLFPEGQKVCCPSCDNSVSANNLNIQNNIAKCNSCDIIFSFSEHVEQLSNQHNISQEILKPEGIELSYFRDELDISVEQPWGTIEIIFVAFFPLIVLLATAGIISLIPPGDIAKALVFTFWIASIISYIAYFFIRKKHKIYINIDDRNLHIERRPRKFIKDKQYAIQDIDQVYIKNIISSGNLKGIAVFMIVNGLEGQKHVELIKSVNSRSKAKYIEQEVERKLGITDRRVPDEDI